MGSRPLALLEGVISVKHHIPSIMNSFSKTIIPTRYRRVIQSFSTATSGSSLPPPHVSQLAETARISLTPSEVEELAPKIQQVIDWFGQLQDVELQSVKPALRADMDGDNLREDISMAFENREAVISAVPSYEEPYIKVPKVLSKT
ncbi:hypothetical protein SAY87_002642 [Trapa incisa]|uniref:Glutamyl-tRNA(Gln) amidotransferase subunit C, chloroplastic/mitochondrial n=1 Tax=Trapa incisa TaxID=236973 RepID=A0AAN7JZZ5_9MYRT|nr:hypothetical protein SAY87_002642 [Trapa incisa]